MNNTTFSKKPWIPEFFPRGTVVEFDTSLVFGGTFGTAGTGEVVSVCRTEVDNLVLELENINITESDSFPDPVHVFYSSSHVTRIVKRGNGSVVFSRAGFDNASDRYYVPAGKKIISGFVQNYFQSLLVNTVDSAQFICDIDLMSGVFLKHHREKVHSKKQLRRWFQQNKNRFILSTRDQYIIQQYRNLDVEIALTEETDCESDHGDKYAIHAHIEVIFLLRPKVLHWDVLSLAQTTKRLRYGHKTWLIEVMVNTHKFMFFSDNPGMDYAMVELIRTIFNLDGSDISLQVSQSLVSALPDFSVQEPIWSLLGLVTWLDYVMKNDLVPDEESHDDTGLLTSDRVY